MKLLLSGKIRPILFIAALCIVLYTFAAAGLADGENHCGYFGNQLTQSEKEIYEKLYAVTPEAPTLTFSEDGKTLDDFYTYLSRIYTAVVADHPAYRMKWGRHIWYDVLTETGDQYQLTMTRQPYQTDYLLNKSESRKRGIVSRVRSDADRYTKLRDLATIIWKETKYDDSANMAATEKLREYADSATGILAYNTAVCAGYADATKILCDALGIPCVVVGNAGHAWNFVQMEDGNWYSLDLSANALGAEEDYFLLGSKSQRYLDNSNYHLSALYLGNPGDFHFPAISEAQYEYQGEYSEEYQEGEEATEPEGKYIYSDNGDGTCTITGYEGRASGDLDVPSDLGGLTVTVIGESAFLRCEGFTGNIVIPDTVTEIREGAFQRLENMTGTITFSRNLASIGDLAFAQSGNLSGTLEFPETLKSIGSNAFYDCVNLIGSVRLPENLEYLGSQAFYWCPKLSGEFYLPDGIPFEANMISETSIQSIRVSETNELYTTFDGMLFSRDMTKLIYVPAGKTGSLVIPEGVEVIGAEACTNMTGNRQLTGTLKLPSTLKTVEKGAFIFHTFTGNLILPEGLREIGTYAFTAAEKVTETGTQPGGFTGSLVIPDSVTFIGDCAFLDNAFDGALTLSSGLTEIGNSAFLYNRFQGDLVIPDTVTSIGESCFSSGDSNVNVFANGNLVIGKGVKTIHNSAFSWTGVKSVSFPEGLEEIGANVFSDCPNLEVVNIPDSVRKIGYSAFSYFWYNCRLSDIYLWNDQVEIEDEDGRTLGQPGTTTVHGNPGSTAEAYANAYGYRFASLEEPPAEPMEPGWAEDENGWIYVKEDRTKAIGWQEIDGAYYCFDENGYMRTGWYQEENIFTYYLGEDGKMVTGWLPLDGKTYYMDATGLRVTGPQFIDGKQYLFAESGEALTDQWYTAENGDQFYLGSDGAGITGFADLTAPLYNGNSEDKNRYYFDENGVMQTGWQVIDQKTYYFGTNGIMYTGWFTDETGAQYYLGEDGVMQTGWITLTESYNDYDYETSAWVIRERDVRYYLGEDGKKAVGWQTIDGKNYYFNDAGAMQTGWVSDENGAEYYLDESGVMQTGWLTRKTTDYRYDESLSDWVPYEKDVFYYLGEDGKKVTGWQQIGQDYYYFLPDGLMKTGWHNDDNGTKYYLNDDGKMVTDSVILDGYIYYFDASGTYTGINEPAQDPNAMRGWAEEAGAWKYYAEDGSTVTGWLQLDGAWYYMNAEGVMQTGWVQAGGAWYYMNASGVMQTGWVQAGGAWYYMNADGIMQTGWVQAGGAWYYMNASGVMQTGWVDVGGAWYYMNASGVMQTGWLQSGSSWYYLKSSGVMATGWTMIRGTWYYFDPSGLMATGWQQMGSAWYYFKASGAMVTGWFEDTEAENALPEGQRKAMWYWFDDSGAMATGWKEIGGQWEMFDDSGLWLYTWNGQ